MNYVCAWCKCELPKKEDGDERASHGICIPCALKELPKHLHAEFLRKRGIVDVDRVAMGRCF